MTAEPEQHIEDLDSAPEDVEADLADLLSDEAADSAVRRTYGLAFACGVPASTLAELSYLADTVVEVNPHSPTPEAVLSAFAETGLSPSDLTAKALFVAGPDAPAVTSILLFSALVGFSGRFPDTLGVDGGVISLSGELAVARSASRLVEENIPEEVEAQYRELGVIFDGVAALGTQSTEVAGVPTDPIVWDESLIADSTWLVPPVFSAEDGPVFPIFLHDHDAPAFTPEAAARARFSLPVAFVPPDDPVTALRLFVAVCGLRSTRKRPYRMPLLWDPTTSSTVSAEQVATVARQRRHRTFIPTSEEIVPPSDPDMVQFVLDEARRAPIIEVLKMFRSTPSADGLYWRCPRRDKHAHGDTTPSLEVDVKANKVRCATCDRTWIDPVMLVMLTTRMSPTEAAAVCGVVASDIFAL